jgi:hypothetical protein
MQFVNICISDTFKTETKKISEGDPVEGTSLTLSCKDTEAGYPTTVTHHKWHKDGSVIDGQTGSDLTLNPLTTTGENGEYKCIKQNSAGWTSLSDATGYTLTVLCKYIYNNNSVSYIILITSILYSKRTKYGQHRPGIEDFINMSIL